MRIYLAGQYRNKDIIEQEANIRRGRQAAAELIAAGHAVECPWLDRELLQAPGGEDLTVSDLQRSSMSKLKNWAQAICLLENWEHSEGTHAELCVAARMGLSVMWFFCDSILPEHTDFCYVLEEYIAVGKANYARDLEAVLAERQQQEEESEADAPAPAMMALRNEVEALRNEVEALHTVVSCPILAEIM